MIEKAIAKSLAKNTQEMLDLKKELDEVKRSQKNMNSDIHDLKTENNLLKEINKLLQEKLDHLVNQSQGHQLTILSKKTDDILGSLAYLADEYVKIRHSTYEMKKVLKMEQANMSSLQDKVHQIEKNLILTASDLDKLEQFGRRENLEIHGIPF